jgi:hypothetical protein
MTGRKEHPVEQLRFEIGQEFDKKPAIPLADETTEKLIELMAEAIVAVHLTEGDNGDE